jgi:glycosyltransferase involved in cell wall biosynthesis
VVSGWRSKVRRAVGTPVVRLGRALGVDAQRDGLVLVTGGGEWVMDQIAAALAGHLRPHYASVDVLGLIAQRRFLTRANVHFLCRPAFFTGRGIAETAASNRIVVSWLHGGPRSPEPELRAASAQLARHWRRVRQFIVPNRTTHENVLECGVDPAIVHIIPNGVDTQLFRPAASAEARRAVRRRLGLSEDAFVVGSFQRDGDDEGNPKLVKGPDTLVETLGLVQQRHPVTALLSGSGRTYVERGLTAARVPYVRTWAKDQQELAELYHALDVYLVSSREEGGPTALRESMASAVPVVSTRMGLAADVIEHGVNGFLAGVADSPGLAKLIIGLVENPATRTRVTDSALQAVRALDFRVIADRYRHEVYRVAFA